MNKRFRISTARRRAFDILKRVELDHAYAANLIAEIPEHDVSSPDRRLIQELVLGVLRWQLQLDFLIGLYIGSPSRRLDLSVSLALRLGLYQIRFLTRVPISAAVNESVELVKQGGIRSAAGLVNSVLRRAAKDADRSIESLIDASSAPPLSPLKRDSIILSHPEWLIERWSNQFGEEEALALAAANNRTPAVAIRLNSLKQDPALSIVEIEREGIGVTPSTLVKGAYLLNSGSAGALANLVSSGAVYFQDEGSQLVARLVDPQPGERILDLCAAPGSKTSLMAELMGNTGLIVAADLHHHRLFTLTQIGQRLGVTNVTRIQLNGAQPLPFSAEAKFDRVLLDAPCSGTGTLRHNPEIKWRLDQDQIGQLANLQRELLVSAAEAVKIGGLLVYSTCSLEVEEGEQLIADFLRQQRRFTLGSPLINSSIMAERGLLRTFPHRDNTDGFFVAVLIRSEG